MWLNVIILFLTVHVVKAFASYLCCYTCAAEC